MKVKSRTSRGNLEGASIRRLCRGGSRGVSTKKLEIERTRSPDTRAPTPELNPSMPASRPDLFGVSFPSLRSGERSEISESLRLSRRSGTRDKLERMALIVATREAAPACGHDESQSDIWPHIAAGQNKLEATTRHLRRRGS